MRHALYHIAIGLSFLYLPWYVTAALILIFAFVTGFLIEAFLWAFFIDIFYGSTVSLWGVSYVFSIATLILLPVITFIRRRVSW